jgi:hypothetical protein
MKKYLSMILAAFLATSCMDMELLPNDKTVDEDFWQSKSDVSLMVNGAYKQFASTAVQQRLIVWGGFRSDELILNTAVPTNDGMRNALNQIQEVNIETTNTFSDWSSLYTVINYCNIVMEKAGNVMNIDPSYTESDYLSDRSQMLALRALCYFYLVRTFRDVPYTTTAYMTESQDRVMVQLPPTEVLQNCINDLLEAEKNALSPFMSGWKRTGWITKDAIQSILADIYLWRGSVLHSDADYQAAIAYCDKVIESKKLQAERKQTEGGVAQDLDYPLVMGSDAYKDLYVSQNSEETIFETQYYSNAANTNAGLAQMYYGYQKDKAPYLVAPLAFGKDIVSPSRQGDDLNSVYLHKEDARYWNNCMAVTDGTLAVFPISKYVNQQVNWEIQKKPVTVMLVQAYDSYGENFIIYRLADILLMKAEALVASVKLAGENVDPEDTRVAEAFEIVNQVYKRSLSSSAWASGAYLAVNYTDPSALERLVLQERLRELCFEGKRWFDLLRFNYRNQETPCNYGTMLADQGSYMKNYQDFLDVVGRKYDNGASRTNKMKEEPRLYLPVPHSDIITCRSWLRQNPSYTETN